jgi:hypothetical protein
MMLAMGVAGEDLPELFERACLAGQAFGLSTTESLEQLAKTFENRSADYLAHIGVVFSTKEAYEDYAESIGTTADNLSDVEKQTAFVEGAINALMTSTDKYDYTIDDTKQALERWDAWIVNVKTNLGALGGEIVTAADENHLVNLIRALSDVTSETGEDGWAGALDAAYESLTDLVPGFDLVSPAVDKFIVKLTGFVKKWDTISEAIDNAKEALFEYFEEEGEGFGGGGGGVRDGDEEPVVSGEKRRIKIPVGPGTFEGTYDDFLKFCDRWDVDNPDVWWNKGTPLQVGGIVTKPTHAILGEAGPEAVIPLNKLGSITRGNTVFNITKPLPFPDDPAQLRELAELLWSMEVREYRALGYR